MTATTIRRHAKLGNLEAHQGAQLWVSEESVHDLAAERDRWISWRVAAEILGCSRDVIPRLIKQGHLEQRPVHRTSASVLRASVEAYAPTFAEQQANAARRNAELEQARVERNRGPADGDVWLDVQAVALLLGLSKDRILQKIRAEQLPATQTGRRWWIRRGDAEQAAAARAFLKRSDLN